MLRALCFLGSRIMIDRYERYQRLEILLQRFSAATTLEEMGQVLIDIGEATGEPDLRRLSLRYAELLSRVPDDTFEEQSSQFGT